MNNLQYWRDKWSGRPLDPPTTFAKRAFPLIHARGLTTLLDLGCGDGRDSLYFSRHGLQVTAVDYSESGINKLRSLKRNIHCLVADIRDIRFENQSFDVIYAHLSLHYFDDLTTDRILDDLHRVLRKGGLIFIKCKSIEDPLFGQGEEAGPNMFTLGHLRHFFSKQYMADILNQFKVIKLRRNSSKYHDYRSAFIEAVATKETS